MSEQVKRKLDVCRSCRKLVYLTTDTPETRGYHCLYDASIPYFSKEVFELIAPVSHCERYLEQVVLCQTPSVVK